MDKIMKHEPFTHMGDYEAMDQLIQDVSALTDEEWNEFDHRQKRNGFGQTQTIPLIFDHEQLIRHILHRHYDIFELHLNRFSGVLENAGHPSLIKRANLVRLRANSVIPTHTDQGEFLNTTRRIHLPIITNPGCTFTVGEETRHLPVGQMWEINNTGLPHSVNNGGDTPRIHLIVDVR
jgi:hypothetical protein